LNGLSPRKGHPGRRGQAGARPQLQVSPQHLLNALVSDASEQGLLTGVGISAGARSLATAATSSGITFPNVNIRDPGRGRAHIGQSRSLPLSPFSSWGKGQCFLLLSLIEGAEGDKLGCLVGRDG
jgi:hypothetical protein